ncbi:MAG: beta-galactosidase [Deltaproteobacteria bacterium]
MRNSKCIFSILVLSFLAAASPGLAGPQALANMAGKKFDLIRWNGGKFIYGVDYYPEAWDESQWEKDAEMMQAAHINFVRMAEFAWVKMEPEEGKFDFDWLDRALKILNAHGIRAVLGTPTVCPPAWLYAKYPDIAAMDEHGVRYRFGSRRNYCMHNPHFLAATRAIVKAMAEHYKNHPGVLGWQIDNEFGSPDCYDEYCQRAFQDWSRTKYGSLDTLNKAWGLVFWGHTLSEWSQVPMPWNTLYNAHNPSMALDYKRFFNDATRDYLKLQVDMLRELSPEKAITTNEMGMFDNLDYSSLNREIDFVAWDSYPMIRQEVGDFLSTALSHDLMRGSKDQQNFMVMEEQGGLPGWQTFWSHQDAPEYFRVWAYQAVAHGADGICYFRWRTSRYGTEQYWQGVLDQDSYPNQRYKMVEQTGKEFAQLASLVEGSTPAANVALLVSPDSRWAFHIQPLTQKFNYNRQMNEYYSAFRRAGAAVNVVFPQDDFSNYKLLVVPSLFVVGAELAGKLTKFVEGGGTLILSFRSGVKDEHNVFTDLTLPGPLASIAGIAIHDYDPETTQKQEIVTGDGKRYPGETWFDILTPSTAKPIATFGKLYYAGKPAVTMNRAGKGNVFYVGTESTAPEFYDWLGGQAIQAAGIARGPQVPKGVEMAVREKGKTKLIFLMNFTDAAQTVSLKEKTRNALTGAAMPAILNLKARDAMVLTTP